MTGDDATLEARALALFEASLEQPSDTRRAWIIARTEDDPALRDWVLGMLSEDATLGGRFKTGGALRAAEVHAESMPERIGQYRIVRLIGRGGMGSVYLAERQAGDFEHQVAIKIVRGFKRGPRLAERLRFERRTLAGLQHPNIAQLFDGGETEDGEPYFIMEYVRGAPLHEYLERAQPALKERLRIFRSICEAVQYAHQKLIVHRDLSPSNVLVTEEGRVKLIDFGISRSISDSVEGGGAQMTLTKGYAAPERLLGEAATTLSDVYSLGAILRDMLAPASPGPSGDLEAIAAKAMHDDPSARYQSAASLIADLDQFAAGKPVLARNGGAFYAAGKFIRRRKLAVGAGVLVALGVVVALGVTSALYRRAEVERAEADRRFTEVRELAEYMLFDLYDTLADVPGATLALSGIADKSRAYLDALSESSRASPALRLETAIGYRRLGDVVGNPIGANLGRRAEAGELLEKAYQELDQIVAASPENIAAVRGLADAAYSRSVYEFIALDDNAKAADYARRAEALYAKAAASGEGTLKDEISRIAAKMQSGKPLTWMGEGEGAVAALDDARGEAEALLQAHPDDLKVKNLAANANTVLAETMSQYYDVAGGDYATALPFNDRGIELLREIDAEDGDDAAARRNLVSSYFKRALTYYSLEDDERVLADLIRAEKIADEFLAKDPNDKGMKRMLDSVLEQKAMTLAYLGRHDEAIALGQRLLAAARRRTEAEPDNPAWYRELTHLSYMIGEVYLVAGQKQNACELFSASRENWRTIEKRWEISDYDKETSIKALDEYLADCS